MGIKGRKSKPGIPELWDEVKKTISATITPTAIAGLDKLAKQRELSRSELIERIGREIIKLSDDIT